MSKAYFDKNGTLQYAAKDEDEKCFSSSQICDTSINSMACRTGWWRNGYWNNWWGWRYNWGVYGENLTYLYTEIEAPPAFRCGTVDNCPGSIAYYCEDVQASSCGRPRIARCKTYGCVSDYNSYYGGYNCDIINGKDREKRCCKAPSNFECEEGGCDYDYEIVKKEYTVEYELVKPAHACFEKTEYPKTACTSHWSIPVYSSTCEEYRQECGTEPEAKCDTGYYWWYSAKCPENNNPPSPGYGGGMTTNSYVTQLWELDDCECGYNKELGYHTCPSCYDCKDFEDCNYDLIGYNSRWYWYNYGFSGYIGDDCCLNNYWSYWGWAIGPCPIDAGDGSENPWWCDGEECSQKASGEESEGDSGPYTSYKKCMEECSKDETGNTNKCIPDSKSYTRGYCCDANFIENMQNAINDGCAEEGPTYVKTTKEKLCSSSDCSNDLIVTRTDDMCTYNTKYCSSHSIKKTISDVIYTYDPPIQNKAYNRICGSCSKESNDECEKDPQSKCPKNTEIPVIINTKKYIADEILETQTVKLIMVFCKITTKECVIDYTE